MPEPHESAAFTIRSTTRPRLLAAILAYALAFTGLIYTTGLLPATLARLGVPLREGVDVYTSMPFAPMPFAAGMIGALAMIFLFPRTVYTARLLTHSQIASLMNNAEKSSAPWNEEAFINGLAQAFVSYHLGFDPSPYDLRNLARLHGFSRGRRMMREEIEEIVNDFADGSYVQPLENLPDYIAKLLRVHAGVAPEAARKWAGKFVEVHVATRLGGTVPDAAQIRAALCYALPLGPDYVGQRQALTQTPPTSPAGPEPERKTSVLELVGTGPGDSLQGPPPSGQANNSLAA